MARSKILETRGNSRKVSNAGCEIETLIYLKKFVDVKKLSTEITHMLWNRKPHILKKEDESEEDESEEVQ